MNKITKICDDEKCTGCAACFNACRHNAIKMYFDDEGFLRPVIEVENCVECGLCKKVCPENNSVDRNKEPLFIYSGWSKNEKTRLSSASGGAFTELATYFIEKFHGIVFGVEMNEELEARHIAVQSINALKKLQGSKYIQSNIHESYCQVEHYLKEGRNILFSGTPCQVAGLKSFLKKEYMNLYTVDLVCHGVPSKRLFDDYIKYLERKLQHQVYEVKFRCKKNSWIFFNMAVNSHIKKNTYQISYEYEGAYYSDPFIRGFLRDNALRPSCYQCQYSSTSRVADFTFADWWGYKAEGLEDKGFEKKGVSLIFVNTQKAKQILPHLNLVLKERQLADALKTNIALKKPFDVPDTRKDFWYDYSKSSFDDMVIKWMCPEKLIPTRYLNYKMSNSCVKQMLMLICRIYEKACRFFKFKIIKIEV